MATWQKVITSGSMAQLSSLIVENIPPDLIGGNVLTYISESGKFRITGSYGGSSSYAFNSATASYVNLSNVTVGNADTASYVNLGGITIDTASYATTAQNVLGSITSASYATTAQNVLGSILNATSASYSTTAQSTLGTSSYAHNAGTASHAINTPLPTDPTFTTITTTGNISIGNQLSVTNGSTFSSGVAINSNLDVQNNFTLGTTSDLVLSSSKKSIHLINSNVNNDFSLGLPEASFIFTPKETLIHNSFINLQSPNNTIQGLRFIQTIPNTDNIISTITTNTEGTLIIEGSGNSTAGSVEFKGESTKFHGFIKPPSISTPLTVDGKFTVAGLLTSLAFTTLGQVSCGNFLTTNTSTFLNTVSINSLTSGTNMTINNNGNVNTSGSITANLFSGPLLGTASYADISTNALGTASYADTALTAVSTSGTSSYSSKSSHTLISSSADQNLEYRVILTGNEAFSTIDYKQLFIDGGNITYNPFKNTLTVPTFIGNLTGTASHATVAESINGTASYADAATTAITTSGTASYATVAQSLITGGTHTGNLTGTASHATIAESTSGTASYATNATNATTASYADTVVTASFALNIPEGLGSGGGLWYDGTTYWSSSLQANGNVTKIGIGRQPTNYSFEVNGTMAATQDVIAFMGSDRRLKDNIKPINDPIGKIKQIGGYTFDWNDNQNVYKGNDVGVIAQEIEEILPSLVQTREDGYKGVKYDKIVALLIEAIKDQQNQIDELKKLI